MSTEKFSPQLLKSILEAEGIDTSGLSGNTAEPGVRRTAPKKLSLLERKRALKTLSMLIGQFRSGSDELLSFPLEELHEVLCLLAELAAEARQSDVNREEKRKVLHVAAAMLRRMLHMPDATHYRVLGLENGATPEEIEEHYRLLHELFWFDEAIDPQRRSRLRISEAYSVLKDPRTRQRYDEDLAQLERQLLSSLASGRGRKIWWGIVAVTFVAVGTVLFLYLGDYERNKAEEEHLAGETASVVSVEPKRDGEMRLDSEGGNEPAAAVEKVASDDARGISEEPEASSEVERKSVVAASTPEGSVKEMQSSPRKQKEQKHEIVQESKEDNGQRKVAVLSAVAGKSSENTGLKKDMDTGMPDTAMNGTIRRYSISRAPEYLPKETSVPERGDIAAEKVSPHVTPVPEESLISPPRIVLPQPEFEMRKEAVAHPSQERLASMGPAVSKDVSPVMVVVGSPRLPLSHLDEEQVRAIFLAQDPRLPDGEPVTIVTAQGDGAVKAKFYRDVLGKSPRQLKIHWAKIRFQGRRQPVEQVADEEGVKERVAKSTNAIGIIKSSSVDDSVKVLFMPR